VPSTVTVRFERTGHAMGERIYASENRHTTLQ